RAGFPEEWLTSTFSAATVGNGIMAVLAGVVAQVAADKLGDIGPFQASRAAVAIALTLLALSLLMLWEENYGYGEEGKAPVVANGDGVTANGSNGRKEAPASTTADAVNGGGGDASVAAVAPAPGARQSCPSGNGGGNGDSNGGGPCSSGGGCGGADGGGTAPGLRKSVAMAWDCIVSDHRVLLLGMVQSLFEGGTFTFVFMWVPTLQGVLSDGVLLPTGLIFSSFMVCITIGGVLFSIMLRKISVELASAFVFFVASASMTLPALTRDFQTVLGAFLVLETCVGAFYSCSGLMRSR
ncbi:unnamed protein product, partial [Ectocarpus fasciculatus]